MKHPKTNCTVPAENKEYNLITQLQKKCISDIARLCFQKNKSTKKRRILSCISSFFFFISVFTLFLSLTFKLIHNKSDRIYSIISAISTALSLIFAVFEKLEAINENSVADEIKLLENVIDTAENI